MAAWGCEFYIRVLKVSWWCGHDDGRIGHVLLHGYYSGHVISSIYENGSPSYNPPAPEIIIVKNNTKQLIQHQSSLIHLMITVNFLVNEKAKLIWPRAKLNIHVLRLNCTGRALLWLKEDVTNQNLSLLLKLEGCKVRCLLNSSEYLSQKDKDI